MFRMFALIFVVSNTVFFSTNLLGQTKSPEPTISKVSVEISKKGEVLVSINSVPDLDFEKPEGKKVEMFGFPSADCYDDGGFAVINFNFLQKRKFIFPFHGKEELILKNDQNGCLFDTSLIKDNIGQRCFLRTQRKFGFPFTMEWDIHRQGSIPKNQPTQAGRSLNLNFECSDLESKVHLYLSIQPTDTKYTTGQIGGFYRHDEGQPKELKKTNFQKGKVTYNFQIPKFPENPSLDWWAIFRGDNAIVKRFRLAGPIQADLGIEMVSQGGKVSISKIFPNSPAFKAGIKESDTLLSLNGEKLRNVSTALDLIKNASISEPLELEIKRSDANLKFKIIPN